ncbi:receptor-transporting protein 3-like [Pristis pectinata]|uniref:receptor-transporting protein 3-like n=1 Tax=Pristis pectinata TaxID=685728 RepID=UPI00223CEB1C|nr:receptor-transporting protein 3-like [Pristis pectinata]
MSQVPGTNPWITHFTTCIEEERFHERWTLNFNYNLQAELTVQKRAEGWKIYKTSSFGKFTCNVCSNSWSSARAIILFHYRLTKKSGLVLLRPFRQQCRECMNPRLHKPQVDSTQMNQVFDRLISKILKNCYKFPDVDDKVRDLIPRKTKPHETAYCEACRLGICSF